VSYRLTGWQRLEQKDRVIWLAYCGMFITSVEKREDMPNWRVGVGTELDGDIVSLEVDSEDAAKKTTVQRLQLLLDEMSRHAVELVG